MGLTSAHKTLTFNSFLSNAQVFSIQDTLGETLGSLGTLSKVDQSFGGVPLTIVVVSNSLRLGGLDTGALSHLGDELGELGVVLDGLLADTVTADNSVEGLSSLYGEVLVLRLDIGVNFERKLSLLDNLGNVYALLKSFEDFFDELLLDLLILDLSDSGRLADLSNDFVLSVVDFSNDLLLLLVDFLNDLNGDLGRKVVVNDHILSLRNGRFENGLNLFLLILLDLFNDLLLDHGVDFLDLLEASRDLVENSTSSGLVVEGGRDGGAGRLARLKIAEEVIT